LKSLWGRFLTGRVARRAFLVLGLSAFVPLALMAALSLDEVRTILLQLGERRLAANAKAYGMAVFERLLLAQDLAAASASRARESLPADALARRSFLSLGIAGADGRTVAAIGEPRMPPLAPEALERLAQGKPVVVVARQGASAQVSLVSAPDSEDGRTVVFGELSPEYLWGSVDIYPAATDFCIFEHGSRIVLFCSLPDSERLAPAVDSASGQTLLRSVRWQRDGEHHRAIAWGQFMRSMFGAPDWVFVASQPESFQLAPVTEFRQIYVPVIALALLLVTWLTIRQARGILVPVERLATRARAIARNDFAGRLDMPRNDEFGELASALDNMSARLGHQFAALTALSEIDRLILSTVDTEQVIRTVIARMGDVVPADAVSVTLFDRDDPHHARAYFRGPRTGGAMAVARLDIAPETRSILESDEKGGWIALTPPVPDHLSHLVEEGIRTAYVQPIVWRDAVCGALVLGYLADATRNDEERRQAREFADRIAVAVSSAWRDEQLYVQAHFDLLTGLPNRLLLKDRLTQEIARSQREERRFAVLFIDLDRFKDVNDSFGHSAGDSVLREAAARIRGCVRASDTVSRLGGDEFTVLLANVQHPQAAGPIAENIVRALAREFVIGEHRSFLGASVGIASYPEDGDTAEDLLKNADTAMYRAKSAGRSQAVFFEERMNAEALARLALDRDLRLAIERGELMLHYQPQIVLGTGAVSAGEALLRWRHPKHGMISPSRFIPLAEESGYIEEIGKWALREACSRMRAWQAEGLAVAQVCVNVSPRQFRRGGLAHLVRDSVEEAGIAPGCLELEITEGLLMEHPAEAEAMLRELHAMGIGIALDDFGTGFSSMAYLKRFPVQTIKIDRVFVEGLGRGGDSRAIVAAIIALSHALGKSVVAEGVETAEQLAILGELGCDEIQGYYFAPALPPAEFAEFVRSRPPAAG
jgi:diguanylate cyclase (GGDEF)-like protein